MSEQPTVDAPDAQMDDERIACLEQQLTDAKKRLNRYDDKDVVRRVGVIIAGPIKVAAYQVRDLYTLDFGPIQFHMTYDNTVMGVMGEEAAKLFARFVTMTLDPENETARERLVRMGISNEDGSLHDNYK